MFEFYNRLSISRKLNFMSLSTAFIAGVLSIIFILIYQYIDERNSIEGANQTLTKILAKNIAPAVLFDDSENIKEVLSSLEYEKKIKQAFALDEKWKILGSYSRDDSYSNELLSDLKPETEQFWSGWDLYTISSINIDDKNIGSLVLVTSLDKFIFHILTEAFFILLFMIFGVLLAYRYHTILSQEILIPIAKLNESTNIIIKTRALTARVGVYNDDEIGELAKNFNVMLDELDRSHDELNEQKDLMSYKAHHDALTGLPNRALFNDRLEFALIKASRKKSVVSVFFLDLDHFKKINDTYGHDAGDEVLIIFSKRLKESIRAEDTLARMGGDEFMIIIEDHAKSKTSAVVAQKIIDAMSKPILLGGDTFHLSTSIGISLYSKDGTNAAELIKAADTAMYDAKQSGRNNFKFYQSK
jgi:diguanylate cyclase (GGDEF)-like protein